MAMKSRRFRLFGLVGATIVSTALGGLGWRLTRREEPVRILATSSLRGGLVPDRQGETRLGGLSLVASALESVRYQHQNTIVVDAGNSLFSDAGTTDFATKLLDTMKALGYVALTPGYRDLEVIGAAGIHGDVDIPLLAVNLRLRGEKQAFRVVPALELPIGPLRVGLIGVVDPLIPSENADDSEKIEILDLERSVVEIRAQVNKLREHVDILALVSSAIRPEINKRLAKELPDVDIIFGIAAPMQPRVDRVGRVYLLSAAANGQTIPMAVIDRGNGHAKVRPSELHVTSLNYGPHDSSRSLLRRYRLDTLVSKDESGIVGSAAEPVGYDLAHDLRLEHPFWTYFNRPMYNFVADAVRDAYQRRYPEGGHVDIAFYNSGAIEAGLPAGIVTRDALFRAIPYDNRVVEAKLTGAQILAILNGSALREHGILAVSGLEYVWDFSTGVVPGSVQQRLEDGTLIEIANDRTYRVLMTDFVARGGDAYLTSDSLLAPIIARFAALSDVDWAKCPRTVELLEEYVRRNSPVVAANDRRVKFVR
jgi:2',3'-cyclic-nucleotide 2'-phosphodiesterase (5'-nucleotidase family)